MNRFRLWLACHLTWAASRLAPRVMRPVFAAYCVMLEEFPKELATGRTYGCIVTPWGVHGPAQLMADRLVARGAEIRKLIDGVR